MPQLFNLGVSIPFGTPQQSFTPFGSPQQSLTTASLNALKQQMEETNHEMVNLVTQQVGMMINPLTRDTNNNYQVLSLQMERITSFLGAPPVRSTPVPQNVNVRQRENSVEEQVNQVPENQVHEVQPEIPEERVDGIKPQVHGLTEVVIKEYLERKWEQEEKGLREEELEESRLEES
ncbi:hypothetical protein MTR_0480s0030 [Medicago truncatula]|uniref:Uncharacterized protein n=1 Tax=Medicago truncatula TaxID=3880 RepID=G7ZV26_MEDTR|nr:hypothetical protein MTR_0480s0030 [Medicago truncatula]